MEFVTALILLMLYLLPGCIAISKHRSNASAIMALNIILGWTVLGWVGALIWAMTEGKTA